MVASTSALATATCNIDILNLVRRYNRIIIELVKAQSSSVSELAAYDMTRCVAYFRALGGDIDYTTGVPQLDCPETGPTTVDLPKPPPVPEIENDSIASLLDLLVVARDELTNSSSSRMPTGLNQFDAGRQRAYLAKIASRLAYITANEPLDLPESTPRDPLSGPGAQGI